jgi:hypothetical protein
MMSSSPVQQQEQEQQQLKLSWAQTMTNNL